MLSIVWLRALRNGNWRHFLNALRDASADAKYDVNVGVSGTIVMPTLHACDDNRTLSIELDSGDTVNVPAHIWAHVRPVEPTVNGTDEFVLVAHNSPFVSANNFALFAFQTISIPMHFTVHDQTAQRSMREHLPRGAVATEESLQQITPLSRLWTGPVLQSN